MTLTSSSSDAASSSFSSSMPARRSFASLFAAKRVDEWSSSNDRHAPAYSQSAAVVAEEKFSDLKIDLLMMQLERHLSDASCYSTDNESIEDSNCSNSNSASTQGDADDEAEVEDEECKSAPAADDHIEEFVEEIQPVESALSWNTACDDDDQDCADDDEAADLFDACISNLHAVSALYSRKSLRGSSVSKPTRISPSALRHMSSHRSALSVACAKTAPVRPNPDLAAHNRNLRPSRSALADEQAVEAVEAAKQLAGSTIGPYGATHKRHTISRSLLVHQARLEIAQREAAAMKRQLNEQRNEQHNASSASSPRKASSAPSAAPSSSVAPSMPKALARACASAARRLPQVLQECRDPRWQAVLQAREASKAARKSAQASERGGQCSRTRKHTPTQSQPSVVVQDIIAEENRARKDSAKASRHGVEKVIARELKVLKTLSKSQATPTAAPLASSTLIRSTVVARWVAAHPTAPPTSEATPTAHARLPSKSKRAFQLKAAQRKAAALKAAGISEPVVAAAAPVAAVATAKKSGGSTNHALSAQQYEQRASEAFNTWRKGFYHGNQSRLERPFTGATATKIHLANVAPHVQRAFMARLRSNSSSGGAFVTFHGTNAANIPSILRHGFLVPGRPSKAPAAAPSTATAAAGKRKRSRAMVRVVNGSSFGCGVYSSKTADYSLGYCRGTSSMFICAVINSRSGTVRHHANIVVSFDETHIVPLFLLDFTYGAPPPPRPPTVVSPSVVAARNRAKRAGEQQARAAERRIRDRMTEAPSKDRLRQMLREMRSRMIRRATLGKQTMAECASSS